MIPFARSNLKAGESASMMEGMAFARTRIAAVTLGLAAIAAATAATTAPAAVEKAKAPKVRVAGVTTSAIDIAWSSPTRSGRYAVRSRTVGGEWSEDRGRGRRVRIPDLTRGTVYEAQVAPCRRGRCRPWSRVVRTATLLAPVNGPHPDPGCETFPASDEFNRDVSTAGVAANSSDIIDRINADGGDFLHPDFGSNPHYGIPYVVVPSDQPAVPIRFGPYGDESDPGPYPVPPGAPIEGGSRSNGDRHVVVLRRPTTPGGACTLFELYRARELGDGRNSWSADSGSIFDLGAPLAGQRPDGWTSADAAGLPIYPGLVTYEEVASGEIDHAIRVTFDETRRGYIAPATHYASDSCNADRPPMGLRLRLGAGYDISGFTGESRVIAEAMRRYGLIVADNGSNWYISGSTDRRWDDDDLNQLKAIPGDAFEVIDPGPETSPC